MIRLPAAVRESPLQGDPKARLVTEGVVKAEGAQERRAENEKVGEEMAVKEAGIRVRRIVDKHARGPRFLGG